MQRALAPRLDALRPGLRVAGLIPAALAVATAVAFLLGNGFVYWNDTRNVLGSPSYRGLGWAQLRWMATESHHGQFVPLTWFTLALDYVVWGMNPAGYHLTSLVIHALGELERARAEFEVLRRLHPALAALVAAAGGSS